MRRTSAWWISAVVAGLAIPLAGCGGSGQTEPEYAPLADTPSAAPAPAAAPPPAAAPEIAAVPVDQDPGASEPTAPAGPATPLQRKSPDATATDDLLALAKSAPAAGPPGSKSEASAAVNDPTSPQGPGGPEGYGAMSGGGQRPAGYPGMGGSQDAYASQGNSGMPANYPGIGGSQGGAYEAMSGGGGPAGYPGAPGAAGPGYPGSSQGGPGGGGYGALGGPGGPGIGGTQTADFSSPIKGAETFLAAVSGRDPHLLSESVALRAPQEAAPKLQPIFTKLLEGAQSIDEELLDLLQQHLEDMQVVDTNRVSSTARLGVIIGRQTDSGDFVRRTITMRREKAGWKVADLSGPSIIKAPPGARPRGPGQGGAGGAAGPAGYGGPGGYSSGGGGAGSFDPR